MLGFTYYTPTKVAFGKGSVERVGELMKQFGGTRVLIHYGGQSAVRSGVLVEDGMSAYQGVVRDWAELVLCTGSTLCNGSFVNFLDIGKPVLFFGTSCAGAARILGAERFCPMSA